MIGLNDKRGAILVLLLVFGPQGSTATFGQHIALVEQPPDPNGTPRPARDAHDVPLRTSLYIELKSAPDGKLGTINPDTVAVRLEPERGQTIELLQPGRRFVTGGVGWLRPKQDAQGVRSLAVYIEPGQPLEPSMRYTARVSTGTEGSVSWSFPTEPASTVQSLNFTFDLAAEPVRWHGRFFSGVCNVVFCTQAESYGPTYDLMAEARKQHPRLELSARLLDDRHRVPAVGAAAGQPAQHRPRARDPPDRRDRAAGRDGNVVLRVEDVFGHEQYGIPAGRPVGDDYHPGDEVLIADGLHDARTRVIAADSAAGTVTVAPFATPPGGWKIAYDGPLPDREDPDAPGLFPPGRLLPAQVRTPRHRLLLLGPARQGVGPGPPTLRPSAAGQLRRCHRATWHATAGAGPPSRIYAQWHEVGPHDRRPHHRPLRRRRARLHLERLQRARPGPAVLAGRLERAPDVLRLHDRRDPAGLRGPRLRLEQGLHRRPGAGRDLRHPPASSASSSPTARPAPRRRRGARPCRGTPPFADRRLDGKRSRRVEALCRAHDGKGSPCDFVSIHAYNRSELMAAKLIRAKEMALEIDPDYYRDAVGQLARVVPRLDAAARRGGGRRLPGQRLLRRRWCADVVHRQLLQAARDPRYAYGETILTVWPPPSNFAGLNAVTRVLHVDDDGDGRGDRDGDRADADLPRAGPALGPGRSLLGAARSIRRRPRRRRLRLARRPGRRPGRCSTPTTRRTRSRGRRHRSTSRSTSTGSPGRVLPASANIASIATTTRRSG